MKRTDRFKASVYTYITLSKVVQFLSVYYTVGKVRGRRMIIIHINYTMRNPRVLCNNIIIHGNSPSIVLVLVYIS